MYKEEYIERTTKIIHQLDTERLKKVYTVAKTLLEISKEKRKGAWSMAKKKEEMNLATEIICMVKRKLWRCRVALMISLAGNIIMAAVLVFR